MAFPTRIIGMTIDPSNPDEIYAGLEVGGIIRSLDGGETWQDCTQALISLAEQGHLKSQLGSDTEIEGMMDSHAVEVSAARPGTIFLSTRMGLFCSPDRGESWREVEIWRFSPFSYGRDIQTSPHDPNTLYVALSPAGISQTGAIYRSQDGGQTWQRFDHDVTPHSTMMTIALNRQDPNLVYCAQGYSVFEFNADESQCFRRLGCHVATGFRDVRRACPPQQSNRRVAQRRHQLGDVPTAPL